MSSRIWLLVEWVNVKKLVPVYGIVNVNISAYSEKELKLGNVICLRFKNARNVRRARILRISNSKRYVSDRKNILDKRAHSVISVLKAHGDRLEEIDENKILAILRDKNKYGATYNTDTVDNVRGDIDSNSEWGGRVSSFSDHKNNTFTLFDADDSSYSDSDLDSNVSEHIPKDKTFTQPCQKPQHTPAYENNSDSDSDVPLSHLNRLLTKDPPKDVIGNRIETSSPYNQNQDNIDQPLRPIASSTPLLGNSPPEDGKVYENKGTQTQETYMQFESISKELKIVISWIFRRYFNLIRKSMLENSIPETEPKDVLTDTISTRYIKTSSPSSRNIRTRRPIACCTLLRHSIVSQNIKLYVNIGTQTLDSNLQSDVILKQLTNIIKWLCKRFRYLSHQNILNNTTPALEKEYNEDSHGEVNKGDSRKDNSNITEDNTGNAPGGVITGDNSVTLTSSGVQPEEENRYLVNNSIPVLETEDNLSDMDVNNEESSKNDTLIELIIIEEDSISQ